MKTHLIRLGLAGLFILAAPGAAAQEAVWEPRTGAAARRILDRSDKVIIAGFRVAFDTGAAAAGDDAVDLAVALTGVSGGNFQRITEDAYRDFRAQLERAGVAVLGTEVLKANPSYRALGLTPSSGERPCVRNTGEAGNRPVAVYSPEELPLFFGHFDGGNLGEKGMDLDNWRALNQLSVETKAVVLVPTVVVEFGGMAPGAEPRIALVAGRSNVAVFHARVRLAGDMGNFRLGENLEVPGGFGALRQRVLAADPAAFSRLSLQGLKSFNRAAGAFIAAK